MLCLTVGKRSNITRLSEAPIKVPIKETRTLPAIANTPWPLHPGKSSAIEDTSIAHAPQLRYLGHLSGSGVRRYREKCEMRNIELSRVNRILTDGGVSVHVAAMSPLAAPATRCTR